MRILLCVFLLLPFFSFSQEKSTKGATAQFLASKQFDQLFDKNFVESCRTKAKESDTKLTQKEVDCYCSSTGKKLKKIIIEKQDLGIVQDKKLITKISLESVQECMADRLQGKKKPEEKTKK